MQRYKYNPLKADGSSIRLLRIEHSPSANYNDPLSCSLFHASITDTDTIFEALSYVWGDASQTVDLEIDGSIIPITHNLDTALRSLRPLQTEADPWILWVDAICIDQTNVEERGQQVQLMWEIYSRAVAVTVWLGPEEGESQMAMTGFAFRETHRRLEERKVWHPTSSNPCGCHAGDFETEPPTAGVEDLLRRPWFRRVWVLQEVAAAKELYIACGDIAIRGEDFYEEINGIVGFYASFTKMMRLYRPVLEFMNPASPIFQAGTMPLSLLIEMFRSWEATDPRDKVYALLGLSSDARNAPSLRPDYKLSQSQIAQKVIEFALPESTIISTNTSTNDVTFDIDAMLIGRIMTKSSGGNTRYWDFNSRRYASHATDLFEGTLHPRAVELFEKCWMINMPNERKLQLSDFVCVLRGARLPSILNRDRKDGMYALEMLATPEPEPNRTYKDPPPEMSWAEALGKLEGVGEEAFGLKLRLTWNPFSPLEPSQKSQTGASMWDVRWENTMNALRRQQGDMPREISRGT
ncbi:hypothetical protein IFR05_009051 [Cadophora sp. M221]|nr:hypothetical protein IFR05_009051 [Cadophora sp. M221]